MPLIIHFDLIFNFIIFTYHIFFLLPPHWSSIYDRNSSSLSLKHKLTFVVIN